MIKCASQRNMIQIKHNKLRIPTGGRLTRWLFTRRGGVEFGATEDKSIQWQGEGFEPVTSRLQVQRPTTGHARLPPGNEAGNFLVPIQRQFDVSREQKREIKGKISAFLEDRLRGLGTYCAVCSFGRLLADRPHGFAHFVLQ